MVSKEIKGIQSGYLKLKCIDKRNSWVSRYFVLRDSALLWYKSKRRTKLYPHKPNGILELNTVSLARLGSEKLNIELVVRSQTVTLQAYSQGKLELWLAILQSRLKALQEDVTLDRGESRRGWLMKLAIVSRRNWKKRFFVLRHGRILYYDSVPDDRVITKPKGVIELTGACSVYRLDNYVVGGIRQNTLIIKLPHISHRHSRDVYLAAETAEEISAWVNMLERAVLRKQGITGNSAVQVALWLRDAGLGHYAKELVRTGYTSLEIFEDCDEKDVQQIVSKVAMSDDEEFRFRRIMKSLIQEPAMESVLFATNSFRSSRHMSGQSVELSTGATRRSGLANTGHVPLQTTKRGHVPSRVQQGDARMYCWGDASHGKLGLPASRTWKMVKQPTHLEALRGKSQPSFIAAGETAMAAVAAQEGLLYTWGSGGSLLGHGDGKSDGGKRMKKSFDRPHLVQALRFTSVHTVSIGPKFMAALCVNGNMYTWGAGEHGQLGLGPDIQETATPQLVPGAGASMGDAVVDVVCAREHLICLTESGRIMTCGNGKDGRLGHGDESSVHAPKLVRSLMGYRVSMIAAGGLFSIAVTASKRDCYSWGTLQRGKMGSLVPSRMEQFVDLQTGAILQVDANDTMAAFVVAHHGEMVAPRRSSQDTAGRRSRLNSVAMEEPEFSSSVYTIGENSVLLGHQAGRNRASLGSDWSASQANAGRGREGPKSKSVLGPSSRAGAPREFPKARLMAALEGQKVVQVSCGKTHCAALCFDGELLMWGSDSFGELGTSYMRGLARPHPAAQVTGFRYSYVSCGANTTCALAVTEPNAMLPDDKAMGELQIPPPPSEDALENSRVAKDQLNTMLETLKRSKRSGKSRKSSESSGKGSRHSVDSVSDTNEILRILPPGSREYAPGWLEHTDFEKNLKYYENEATKEVQWEPPSLSVLVEAYPNMIPPPPPEVESWPS